MDGVRITKQYVNSLQPAGKDEFHWDKLLPGFGVRVQRSGASAYVVKYRAGADGLRGRQVLPKRVTLGSTAKLTPDDARMLAKKLLGQVANGADPAKERRRAKDAAAASSTTTLKAVAERYLTDKCGLIRNADGNATFDARSSKIRGALRSGHERIKVFEWHIYKSKLADRQIEDIKRSEIATLLDGVEKNRGPQAAHKVLAFLSAMFTWCAARTDGFRTPIVRGMGRVKPREHAGTRVLSDQEIRDIWAVLDKAEREKIKNLPPCFARLVRTLLLTGVRLREAGHASWPEIEYLRRDDYQGAVLTIPQPG